MMQCSEKEVAHKLCNQTVGHWPIFAQPPLPVSSVFAFSLHSAELETLEGCSSVFFHKEFSLTLVSPYVGLLSGICKHMIMLMSVDMLMLVIVNIDV